MEIKVRGLDRSTLQAIDDMARKQRKSRNEFLKEQITLLAAAPALRQQEDRYVSLVREISHIIQKNTDIFEKYLEK